MERASGVLMHISSLYGDYSIGSFGNEAKEFVDFLSNCGFKYWQVLPFCMVDECNSPYKSYSAFGGNLYFVDLNKLKNKGYLTENELIEYKQQTPYSCEYVRLYHTRKDILLKASQRCNEKEKVKAFIKDNKYIEEFCMFMAHKAANDEKIWTEWTNNSIDKTILFMWQFIQYEFFEQWKEIKDYANKKDIKIIGDIPFYVSYDSCDVWANKNLFQLDKDNKPKSVAGVPPDYFSEDGQKWGNPLYDWKTMKEDNYKWWQDRLKAMFNLFDVVRIDHFRAIDTYYSIPFEAETAKEGTWKKGPGKEFVDMINSVKKENMVLAEDLGDITKSVTELVEYSKFPGMRVFQFGFMGDSDNPHLPHNYINNSFAYTGTHDNNTLLGYVWELDEYTRKRMLKYCGYENENWDKGYDSIIRTMFQSSAGCVILPIQDILGYGSDTRLNIPGKSDGNWQFRITKEQLNNIDTFKYRELNSLYKR